MQHPRSDTDTRLPMEGQEVTVIEQDSPQPTKKELQAAKGEVKRREAEAIAQARCVTPDEQVALEASDTLSPLDQWALQKVQLAEFLGLDCASITVDWVLWDNSGFGRVGLLALEAQIYHDVVQERDRNRIQRQIAWNQGLCPWDLQHLASQRQMRSSLELDSFLNPDREWTAIDLNSIAERARSCADEIKRILNYTPSQKISNVQIVHGLLSQIGLKVTFRWSRSVPGQERNKIRVYRLDRAVWDRAIAILDSRAQRRGDRPPLEVLSAIVTHVAMERPPVPPAAPIPAAVVPTVTPTMPDVPPADTPPEPLATSTPPPIDPHPTEVSAPKAIESEDLDSRNDDNAIAPTEETSGSPLPSPAFGSPVEAHVN